MTLSEIVRQRLGDETPRARVPLGGDDELVVTPTRMLVYRAEGLLTGESVDEYELEAERLVVEEGRRKATVRLDRGYDGESSFAIPSGQLTDALAPILAGVLGVADVIDTDESIERVYRLGELTLIVTQARVIKHVGAAVWDEEFEEFEYDRVTALEIEQGSVSSQVIIEVDGRPQRIKAPSTDAGQIRGHIERLLLAHHGVDSYAAFRATVAPDDEGDEAADAGEATGEAEEADGAAQVRADGTTKMEFPKQDPLTIEDVVDGSTEDDPDVAAEVDALRVAVERQNEILEDHREVLEQLIEELKRSR